MTTTTTETARRATYRVFEVQVDGWTFRVTVAPVTNNPADGVKTTTRIIAAPAGMIASQAHRAAARRAAKAVL